MANVALGARHKKKQQTAYIDQAQCLRERLLQQLHELCVQEFRVDLPHTRDAGVRRWRGRYVRADSRYSALGVAPGGLPGLIMSQRVLGRHGVSGTRMTSLGRRRHPGRVSRPFGSHVIAISAIVRDVGVSFRRPGALYTCVSKILGWYAGILLEQERIVDVCPVRGCVASSTVRSVFLQFNANRSHNSYEGYS